MTAAPPRPAAGPPAAPPPDRPLSPTALLVVVLLTAAWGGNAPALTYSVRHVPPLTNSAVRFLLGAVVVILGARLQRVSLRPERGEAWGFIRMGLLFTVQIALLSIGAAHTQAVRQALLINTYPLFVPFLAGRFLAGERFSWLKVTGTGLAFAGILLFFGAGALQSRGMLLGDALVTLSAFLLAVRSVYTSSLARRSHPYRVLFWQSVVGVPLFLLAGVLTETVPAAWSLPVLLSIAYQGIVVAGLCFVGHTLLLMRYSPSRVSVGFFLTPLFGALASHLFLGERLSPSLLLGGAAILAGVALANRR